MFRISALVGLLLTSVLLVGCAPSTEAVFEEKYVELLGEHNELLESVTTLEADLADAHQGIAEMSDSLEDCEERRSELEAAAGGVRCFADMRALDIWLDEQQAPKRESSDAVQWFDRALRLQEAALRDGYLINVELDSADDETFTVYCTATLADGSYCWWDPDYLEVYYWLDYDHF